MIEPLLAQVRAEVTMRLRSPATLVALLAFLGLAALWLPTPGGNAASLIWETPDGRLYAPFYTSAYVGAALAILMGVLLTLAGYYLVAGSVRRDRETGVGAILAATPLPSWQYLLGKLLAHAAYLFVIAGTGFATGFVLWLLHGTGPFQPIAFFAPGLLVGIPALAFTAAMAVLFDVTPVLRTKAGFVAWFFFFALAVMALPMETSGVDGPQDQRKVAPFDPSGLASYDVVLRASIPKEGRDKVSSGHVIVRKPITRVDWSGVTITGTFVSLRALTLLLPVAILGLAVLLFDRFDPARGGGRARGGGLRKLLKKKAVEPKEAVALAPLDAISLASLSPIRATPSFLSAVLAEARLLWDSAPRLRWVLLLAAIAAALPSGDIPLSAALVLLLVPALSESAAREKLEGTLPLILGQPGVPRSLVVWKTCAASLFVLALEVPSLVKLAVTKPLQIPAVLAGAVLTAAFATAAGSLTGGGKLFSALFLVGWYVALNKMPAGDVTGLLVGGPGIAGFAFWLVTVGLLFAVALLREGRDRS